jgi:hypothetical protein
VPDVEPGIPGYQILADVEAFADDCTAVHTFAPGTVTVSTTTVGGDGVSNTRYSHLTQRARRPAIR